MSKFNRQLVLEKPEVIGEVPPELLDVVTNYENLYSDQKKVMTPEIEDVVQHIGKLAGKTIGVDGPAIIVSDIKTLGYWDYHRAGTDGWHLDGDGYLVASSLPTEYLVGNFNSNSLDNKLLKRMSHLLLHESMESRPNYPYHYAIAETLGEIEGFDDELQALGLGIWRPEPYQVVHKTENIIHRGPLKMTREPIQRIFFSVDF